MKIETTIYENKKLDVQKNFCSKQCANQSFQAYLILFVFLLKHSDLLNRRMKFKNCMRVAIISCNLRYTKTRIKLKPMN